jgi:hypothetical protein
MHPNSAAREGQKPMNHTQTIFYGTQAECDAASDGINRKLGVLTFVTRNGDQYEVRPEGSITRDRFNAHCAACDEYWREAEKEAREVGIELEDGRDGDSTD